MADATALKTKMRNGETAFGLVLRGADLGCAELVGMTGFDFAWIDMEHSFVTQREAEALTIALERWGCAPLVRVPSHHPTHIGKALDMGAGIVCVPHVDTEEQARRVVHAAKYHPMGRRGFSSCTRGNQLSMHTMSPELMSRKNGENMVMAQIESKEALSNLDAIGRVEGIDILFLGAGDLSQDLGLPGQYKHPDVLDATRRFAEGARGAGKILAASVADLTRHDEFLELGFRMIVCGVDTTLFRKALQGVMASVRPKA